MNRDNVRERVEIAREHLTAVIKMLDEHQDKPTIGQWMWSLAGHLRIALDAIQEALGS